MSLQIPKNKQFISQKSAIIEPSIMQIGLINKRGRLVDSIGPDSTGMPDDKKEMFFMGAALIRSMQKDYDEVMGPLNYILLQRQNLKFILIPADDDESVLIISKKGFDHEKFLKKHYQLLQNKNQFLDMEILEEGRQIESL
jgi:hypothetical protein